LHIAQSVGIKRALKERIVMAKAVRAKFPTSFGVFSPTGHIVMAFPNNDCAVMARAALLAEGFNETEVTKYTKEDVILECEKSNEHAADPLQIGQDVAKIAEYLALAREGCGFVVVHAPEAERSKLAVKLVQPYGLKFAEKYNRLTLEELG
jgi:hypothetical protein